MVEILSWLITMEQGSRLYTIPFVLIVLKKQVGKKSETDTKKQDLTLCENNETGK